MLVLTRRKGEDVHIGQDIVVRVTKIRGGRVMLGIQAPGDVSVHRQEVAAVIKNLEQQTSSQLQERSRHA